MFNQNFTKMTKMILKWTQNVHWNWPQLILTKVKCRPMRILTTDPQNIFFLRKWTFSPKWHKYFTKTVQTDTKMVWRSKFWENGRGFTKKVGGPRKGVKICENGRGSSEGVGVNKSGRAAKLSKIGRG